MKRGVEKARKTNLTVEKIAPRVTGSVGTKRLKVSKAGHGWFVQVVKGAFSSASCSVAVFGLKQHLLIDTTITRVSILSIRSEDRLQTEEKL